MRHGKKFNHLSRTSAHRKAMMANMASSLILNKRISTTTAKAKALRTYIEPLITKAKTDNTHSRRVVFRYLKDKYAVSELFRDIAEKIAERPGGYTRILKTGNRQGDNAEMCFIELVDYNENYTGTGSQKSKTGKKRRRRGGKKKTQSAEQQQTQAKTDETAEDASGKNTQNQAEQQSKPENDTQQKNQNTGQDNAENNSEDQNKDNQ